MQIKVERLVITVDGVYVVSIPRAGHRVVQVTQDGDWDVGTLTIYGSVQIANATAAAGVLLDTVAFGDTPESVILSANAGGFHEPWPHLAFVMASMSGGTAYVDIAYEQLDN